MPRRHVAQYELPANVNFYIEQFFRQYPAFPFRPSEPVSAQFYRLCDSQDWDRGDVRRKKAFKDYKDALTQTFNITYGTEVKALRSWQSLCHVLAIKPVPKSLTACQDVSTIVKILAHIIPLNRDERRPFSRDTLISLT